MPVSLQKTQLKLQHKPRTQYFHQEQLFFQKNERKAHFNISIMNPRVLSLSGAITGCTVDEITRY